MQWTCIEGTGCKSRHTIAGSMVWDSQQTVSSNDSPLQAHKGTGRATSGSKRSSSSCRAAMAVEMPTVFSALGRDACRS
eukprot:185531-Amphidinium_carterae.1